MTLRLFSGKLRKQLTSNIMKQKTHKATAKRLKVTKTGKVKHRKCGQAHFKSRETGDQTRSRRKDETLDNSNKQAVKQLLPNKDIK